MRLYFAYGSNMDEPRMARRCPAARLIGRATLFGHQFFITANGWASVRPDESHEVWGCLWAITLSDEAALDEWEDVAGGLYSKETRVVVPADGEPCQALVYVERTTDDGSPSAWYIDLILASAARHRLPGAYQARLRAWSTGGVPGSTDVSPRS